MSGQEAAREDGGGSAYIWNGLGSVGEEACSGSVALGGTPDAVGMGGSGGESLGRTAVHSELRRREKLARESERTAGFDGDRMRHRLGIELKFQTEPSCASPAASTLFRKRQPGAVN